MGIPALGIYRSAALVVLRGVGSSVHGCSGCTCITRVVGVVYVAYTASCVIPVSSLGLYHIAIIGSGSGGCCSAI